MPYILALLVVIIGVLFWRQHARNAAEIRRELAGVAADVAAAARRFGFRRRPDLHPVESLQDGDVAVAGVGSAFLELGGLPGGEQQDMLIRSLRSRLGMDQDKALQALILGRWLVTQSGGAQPGMMRLVERCARLQGVAGLEVLMMVLRDITDGNDGVMSPQQGDALDEVKNIFGP